MELKFYSYPEHIPSDFNRMYYIITIDSRGYPKLRTGVFTRHLAFVESLFFNVIAFADIPVDEFLGSFSNSCKPDLSQPNTQQLTHNT